MAQSTYVPWWEARGVTTVSITPTSAHRFARCPLAFSVHDSQRSDPSMERHLRRGHYIHAVIHCHTERAIAGEMPTVDDVLARVPVPHPCDDEALLLDLARRSLVGYRDFLIEQGYTALVSSEEYVRTPGRTVVGLPASAVIFSGCFDTLATSAPGTDHLACIDITTGAIEDDLADLTSSFVYDLLVKFAYNIERVEIVQLNPVTGQWARAALTEAQIAAGAATCRAIVAATKEVAYVPRIGPHCVYCAIVARCPAHQGAADRGGIPSSNGRRTLLGRSTASGNRRRSPWPNVWSGAGHSSQRVAPFDRMPDCEMPCRSSAPLGTQVELDLALAHGYRSRAGPDDIQIVETWAESGAVPGARAADGHDRRVRRRERGVVHHSRPPDARLPQGLRV